MSTSTGPRVKKWRTPAIIALAGGGLAIAIILGTPLQGLLVLGLWLLCPILMMAMHTGHEHHPRPSDAPERQDTTMEHR